MNVNMVIYIKKIFFYGYKYLFIEKSLYNKKKKSYPFSIKIKNQLFKLYIYIM
jgi:hypothetical protein